MAEIFPPPQYVRHFPASRHAALIFTAVNLLTTTLAPAPGPPFRQNDWPNPTRPIYRIDGQVQNQLPLTTIVPTKPFAQNDWTNPRVASKFSLTDIPPNLLTTTLAVTDSIARATILSSRLAAQPRRTIPRFDPPNIISTLSIPNIKPFHQDDWSQSPTVYRQQVEPPTNLLTTTLATNVDYLTQGLVLSTNVAIQRAPRIQHQDPPNLLTTTLATTVDYLTQGLVLSTNVAVLRFGPTPQFNPPNIIALLTAPAPFYQNDWPNPVLRTYAAPVPYFPNTSALLAIANIKPFAQNDWPNPVLRVYTAPVHPTPNELVFGFPVSKGHGHKKQFIGEIQSLGVQEDSVILDSSMGIT